MPNQIDRDPKRAVQKYPLRVTDEQIIVMPEGAQILTVQTTDKDGDQPFIWALVDVTKRMAGRTIYVVGTGHSFPVDAGKYIGTFQTQGGTGVWHVFDMLTEVCVE